MDAIERRMNAALEKLERSVGEADWLMGVGIGLIDGRPGVVVSVSADSAEEARRSVDALELDVPVSVRVVGPIRKRPRD